jgi:hypothetical protein
MRSAHCGTSGVQEQSTLVEDRRFNERTRLLTAVQIRQVGAAGTALDCEQYATLIDLSRDGLYFTARSHEYQVGAQLHLTLVESNSECTGEVVRTEALPNGSQGVGVRILAW